MGASERQKGAVFEREVARQMSQALGRDVKRHIGQARDGGHDILADPFVVECKRRRSFSTLYRWMTQATDAAARAECVGAVGAGIPVVVLRADAEDAIAAMPFSRFLDLVRAAAKAHRPAPEYIAPAEHGIREGPPVVCATFKPVAFGSDCCATCRGDVRAHAGGRT